MKECYQLLLLNFLVQHVTVQHLENEISEKVIVLISLKKKTKLPGLKTDREKVFKRQVFPLLLSAVEESNGIMERMEIVPESCLGSLKQ